MHQQTLCDAVCVIFGFCLFAFLTPPPNKQLRARN